MPKPPKPWNQDLPPWVQAEAAKPKARPSPKTAVPQKRPGRAVRPVPSKSPPRPGGGDVLHVRVVFRGEITFTVDGPEAKSLRAELHGQEADFDTVLDALDQWSSAAQVTQEATILEEPWEFLGDYQAWEIDEAAGTVLGMLRSGSVGPFLYHIEPEESRGHLQVDWRVVP